MEVQRWLVTVARSTPRAAQLDRITITRAIKVARKSGLCSCLLDEDTLPHVQHNARKAEVLTREEAHAYLIAAQGVKCYPLLMLLLVCGLRRSEALGLKWSDLSEDGVLTILRQRMRVNHRYTAAPLKTAQSNRQLLLPPKWSLSCKRSLEASLAGSSMSLRRSCVQIISTPSQKPVSQKP